MSVRIILCGACGKMGGNVLSLLENASDMGVIISTKYSIVVRIELQQITGNKRNFYLTS